MRPAVLAAVLGVLCLAAPDRVPLAKSSKAGDGPVRLSGRVVDENNSAIPGAQVTLRGPGLAAPLQVAADPTGAFAFQVAAPGEYLFTAEREGFFRIQDRAVRLTAGENELTLTLNTAREVFEKVDVAYSPKTVDFDRTQPEERLTNTQLLEVPFPSTNTLRNATRVIPGVLQDNYGQIHLNGGTEEQTLYTLDGFEVNDPLTGRLESRVSLEAVRGIEVTPLNPAEFGKGSAGALAIKTSTGDDRFRYSGTNFVPGFEFRKGMYVGGWTPRFNLSGPIKRSRAWFSESLDVQYDKYVVEELPKGQDRTDSWRFSNLLRNQVNLTPSNILYTGFLASAYTAPRTGLSVLDPRSTTVDRRSRQYFFNIKDQIYFRRGALIEIGYGANRTFGREIPQGPGMLIFTPDGRRGNYFQNAMRTAGRDQFLANVFLPSFEAAGGHQMKTGVDVDAVNYSQDVDRTGQEFLRADHTLARRTVYGGSGRLRRHNSEVSWYAQDSWKPRANLLVEAGLRLDWDHLVGRTSWSPRLGVSWAPPRLDATKISGGYGVVYDQSNLRLFSRPLDQYMLTTHYGSDGSYLYGPSVSMFTFGPWRLKRPRYTHWNLGIDQRLRGDLYIGAHYTRRRGRDGFSYVNTVPEGPISSAMFDAYAARFFDAIYALRNWRRDVYDSFQVTVRQTFRKQYEWLAAYTRSRALSNSVVDINAEDPLIVTDNVGRMAWDAPNRFLSWGYLPTRWPNWAVAYLLDTRNGFPFSVYDAAGKLTGPLNERRFPFFFELNLHLERKFSFRGHRWAFRGGFNNITNHKNPNIVNGDTSSPNFLQMYGGQGRAANFRIRWLGKE